MYDVKRNELNEVSADKRLHAIKDEQKTRDKGECSEGLFSCLTEIGWARCQNHINKEKNNGFINSLF